MLVLSARGRRLPAPFPMRRMPGLPQRLKLLLLIRRQDLIGFRHRCAADCRKLADLAAFGISELLDLSHIIGLNRGVERLAGLMQLLPERLRRLPCRLENRFLLRLLRGRQIQLAG